MDLSLVSPSLEISPTSLFCRHFHVTAHIAFAIIVSKGLYIVPSCHFSLFWFRQISHSKVIFLLEQSKLCKCIKHVYAQYSKHGISSIVSHIWLLKHDKLLTCMSANKYAYPCTISLMGFWKACTFFSIFKIYLLLPPTALLWFMFMFFLFL